MITQLGIFNMRRIYIFHFIIWFSISGCVSVTLKTDSSAKISNEVDATPPQNPYKVYSDTKYPTWFNKSTGHSISLISDCREDDFSLKQMANEALTSFDETTQSEYEVAKILTHNNLSLEGEYLKAKGVINSQESQIKAFLFKKGKCNYTCVLAGKPKNFMAQELLFDEFLKGLRFK